MDGNRYEGRDRLLDFNEKKDDNGFVMSKDDLICGASCGFRVFDSEGLAQDVVASANARWDFPTIYCEAWMHLSDDADEIEGMHYGLMAFGGHATRIELQSRPDGRIAKVWGGHEGVVASRSGSDAPNAASALGRPLTWSRRVLRLLREHR